MSTQKHKPGTLTRRVVVRVTYLVDEPNSPSDRELATLINQAAAALLPAAGFPKPAEVVTECGLSTCVMNTIALQHAFVVTDGHGLVPVTGLKIIEHSAESADTVINVGRLPAAGDLVLSTAPVLVPTSVLEAARHNGPTTDPEVACEITLKDESGFLAVYHVYDDDDRGQGPRACWFSFSPTGSDSDDHGEHGTFDVRLLPGSQGRESMLLPEIKDLVQAAWDTGYFKDWKWPEREDAMVTYKL